MPSEEEFEQLEIPFEKIISATNNFAEENLIKDGRLAKIYKGEGDLFESGQSINVAIVRYKKSDLWMFNGILTLVNLKHKNLNSVFGVSDDDHDVVALYMHQANGSLDNHLSSTNLTWKQRLRICVGVSHALSYIHYDFGRDSSVIHGNIKSSKILLDDTLEPKLSGFEFCMKLSVTERHSLRLLSKYMGTLQYMDPSYEETKGLTHKSDIFSFGVVLFEVLFGRKASIPNKDNWYFARLARVHYERKTLDDMINPDLRKQMNLTSLKIFSEVAYRCLNEQRAKRPHINQVVEQLDRALQLQEEYESHEELTVAVKGTSSNVLKGKNLEHLKIRLSDIQSVTENFAQKYCIGSGGYGIVYEAKLYQFDDQMPLGIKEKHTDELPRRRIDVAIKRILRRDDEQGEKGFLTEVEMLTSCNHPNVVSLLGYCYEDPERILVYEHASNGSLSDYFGNTNNMTTLTWKQRIKISLDIACGLKYLHTKTENKQKIIHRDMKSDNILLGQNWEAKIADFGLSKFHPANQQTTTIITNVAGTQVYLDPEYEKTQKLKKESDIFSFGVVLFEILCGRLAYDRVYIDKNEKGLAPIARQCYNEGTLQEMIDPKLKEEVDEIFFPQNTGPNQDSLDTFSEIAYKCVLETQAERPTMEIIIEELEKALSLQEKQKDNLRIPLEHIKLATQNFSDENCIGGGGYWKEYRGEIPHAYGNTTVVAKRLDHSLHQRDHRFLIELEILYKFKHDNTIGLVGYCNEMGEKIIVYEYACNGSLDRYLNDFGLTWAKRLKICIDIASGLAFLHDRVGSEDRVIHGDIKTSNILLNGDWMAKIANFGLSFVVVAEWRVGMVLDDAYSTSGCVDPQYHEFKFLQRMSDIYSLGMVLFEILCGRLTYPKDCIDYSQPLSPQVDWYYYKGKYEEIVFEGIKEQIVQESLYKFHKIAHQCLEEDRCDRPKANKVVKQLKEALEIQEDYEIWEPKLPADYIEIIQMSKTPEIYHTEKKKDLYDMLCKGILLQEGKAWFSIGSNGERCIIISARNFSYKNQRSRKWRSTPQSRFSKVAKMLDISNLKIEIKVGAQLLSPEVNYGVYLVFKFCEPRKFSSKPVYVNLKYQKGNEKLHAYFAKWRDEEWMMIELFRFVNQKDHDTNFEVLLESFSRYYCRTSAIHVEGLEFRPIDNVTHEEIENLKEVQQVLKLNSNMDHGGGMHVGLSEVDGKKRLRISADKLLRYAPDGLVKFSYTGPSTWSRSERAVELLSQQVFRIICYIKVRRLLSPNTDYVCNLVFKISKNCRGLHCPVKVRDLRNRKNKEPEIIYLRSPSLLNRHEANIPLQREDGWMEVNIWKFNSNCKTTINDSIRMNLKVISYEGNMNGLIVCGLEFRPL